MVLQSRVMIFKLGLISFNLVSRIADDFQIGPVLESCVTCLHIFLECHSRIILFQVWDTMIIDSALKTYYDSDIAVMIQSIQRNITVCFSFLHRKLLFYGLA